MIKKKLKSFPSRYKNIKLQSLIDAFKTGPDKLQKSLDGLSDEDLSSHPIPLKWSIKEIVHHTVDSEIVGTIRIMKTLLEPGGALPFYDQDVWVKEMDYNSSSIEDLQIAVQTLKSLRLRTLPVFENAGENDWAKKSVHYEYGKITLRNLLELYADHTERHLEQILRLRQLVGKPLELPIFPKTRLY